MELLATSHKGSLCAVTVEGTAMFECRLAVLGLTADEVRFKESGMKEKLLTIPRAVTAGLAVLVLAWSSVVTPSPAAAVLQPPEPLAFVDPAPLEPDAAYAIGSGRVEVYTSVGNNDGGNDWRTVHALAWLVESVPKGGVSRLAIFNTYQDKYSASLDPTTNQWQISNTNGSVVDTMFSVTKAVRNQLNLYDTAEERKAHVMAIGQRDSILTSQANGSSLAELLMESGSMHLCGRPAGACVSTATNGDMHSKFALFSQTKDSSGRLWENVTLVTTANLNGTSGGSAANTVVVVYGDKSLYDGMVERVWGPMASETATPGFWQAATTGIQGNLAGVRYYPSPRAKDSAGKYLDFELYYLRDRMLSNGGPVKSSCTVRVVHSMFSSGRQGVGNALKGLKADGCRIQIVLDKDFVLDLASSYFTMSEWLGDVIGDIRYQNVHDKTFTMTYVTSAGESNVAFTGSANFNGPGLTADESVIRITHEAGVDAISAHANRLYTLAKYPTAIPVVSVSLDPGQKSIMEGETTRLVATVSPSNATDPSLRWDSLDPQVASVSSTGSVTGLSSGQARIRVRSLQGGKEAVSTIQVVPSTLVPAPTLKAPASVQLGDDAALTAQWSEGDYDGTVTMQTLNPVDETWVDQADVSVSGGEASYVYAARENNIWRAKVATITTPADAVIQEPTRYSEPQSVLVRPAAGPTPTLSGPAKFKSGSAVTFAVTWQSPYVPDLPATLALQYQSGTTWKTKQTVTIPQGATHADFSLVITNSHTWRVVPVSASIPAGAVAAPSEPITVATLATGVKVPAPILTGPSTFKSGTRVTFGARWVSPYVATHPARLDLQYKSGTSWKTKTSITIPTGTSAMNFSLTLRETHDWRLRVASSAVPAGAPRPISAVLRLRRI